MNKLILTLIIVSLFCINLASATMGNNSQDYWIQDYNSSIAYPFSEGWISGNPYFVIQNLNACVNESEGGAGFRSNINMSTDAKFLYLSMGGASKNFTAYFQYRTGQNSSDPNFIDIMTFYLNLPNNHKINYYDGETWQTTTYYDFDILKVQRNSSVGYYKMWVNETYIGEFKYYNDVGYPNVTVIDNGDPVSAMNVSWICTDDDGASCIYKSVPNITIVSPPQNQVYNVSNISFNATSLWYLDSCQVSLNNLTTSFPLTKTINTKFEYTNTSMYDGKYYAYFNCTDFQGRTNRFNYSYFTVSTASPSITINSPKDANYSTGILDYNITSDINISSCNLTLDNWATRENMTMHNPLNFGFRNSTIDGNGTYTVKFNCTKLSSGMANDTEYIVYKIDTILPEVNITDPINDTTYFFSTIDLNFTKSDNNDIQSCWYQKNNSLTNVTLTDCANTSVSFEMGHSNIFLWVNDTAGNINMSRANLTVTTDTSPPSVTINKPTGAYTISTISFNVSLTDNLALSNCSYNVTASGAIYLANQYVENCSGLINETSGTMPIAFGSAIYSFNFYANDTSGNAISTSQAFVVNIPSSSVTGGGGGGGVEETAPLKCEEKGQNWTAQFDTGSGGASLLMAKGGTRNRRIDFSNFGLDNTTITLNCQNTNETRDVCSWITLDRTTVYLEPNPRKIESVYLNFTIPQDVNYGDIYYFEIFVTDNFACSGNIPIEIRVAYLGIFYRITESRPLPFGEDRTYPIAVHLLWILLLSVLAYKFINKSFNNVLALTISFIMFIGGTYVLLYYI